MSLSDKIYLLKSLPYNVIDTEDVKQAVKELKERCLDIFDNDGRWIDEIFGEKLTK